MNIDQLNHILFGVTSINDQLTHAKQPEWAKLKY